MSVYDDRLVLWNPGKLPEDLAIADLKRAHPSKPRNPHIAEVFFNAGFIETWGRGIDKILTSCARSRDWLVCWAKQHYNNAEYGSAGWRFGAGFSRTRRCEITFTIWVIFLRAPVTRAAWKTD